MTNHVNTENRSVLQDWVHELPFMQQSVLIASVRGPDGLRKDHIAKKLNRWLRRSCMIFAFKGTVLSRPDDPDGGSFTGPSIPQMPEGFLWKPGITNPKEVRDGWCWDALKEVVDEYFHHVDEIPHHFQLHLLHAAEILGYKHPDEWTRDWWHWFYKKVVNDMHLGIETKPLMELRLRDQRATWLAAEGVPAHQPTDPEWKGLELATCPHGITIDIKCPVCHHKDK